LTSRDAAPDLFINILLQPEQRQQNTAGYTNFVVEQNTPSVVIDALWMSSQGVFPQLFTKIYAAVAEPYWQRGNKLAYIDGQSQWQ